jgi:hypothetical protein
MLEKRYNQKHNSGEAAKECGMQAQRNVLSKNLSSMMLERNTSCPPMWHVTKGSAVPGQMLQPSHEAQAKSVCISCAGNSRIQQLARSDDFDKQYGRAAGQLLTSISRSERMICNSTTTKYRGRRFVSGVYRITATVHESTI